MRNLLPLVLALLFANLIYPSSNVIAQVVTGAQQQTQDTPAPLNNNDVIEMVKSGLSAEIIVAKIKASVSKFDTSPAALQQLKASGVSDDVILAMVQAPVGVPAPPADATGVEKSESGSSETKAVVYVYRKKNFGTRNMQPSVYVDNVEVARMDDGKYFIIKLDPGKHALEVNKGHSGAQIDMKAGEKYYFRVEMIPGFWKARGSVDYMQKEQGVLEVQKMKPLESKWIKDKSRVTVEEQSKSAQ